VLKLTGLNNSRVWQQTQSSSRSRSSWRSQITKLVAEPLKTEVKVVYLLAEIRKLLEKRDPKDRPFVYRPS
jgi:hypothetical protein